MLVGIKSREIYEAPAAVVLHTAHRELEGLVIPRDLQRLKQRLSQEYADIVYNGLWFSPTREAIDAFVQNIQQRVTGTIRLKLYKGDCRVVGRKSPFALYDQGLATYDEGDTFDHAAAEGFIKIWGLPVETAAKNARRNAAARRDGRPRRSRSSVDGESLVRTFQRRARSRRPSSSASSFRFDRRLFEDDVTGSLAWVEGLAGAGVFSKAEAETVSAALVDILERGRREPAFVDGPDEDVHAFVERQLVERVGDLGKRLHTGRSRNEQVSLDLRLYLRRRIPLLQRQLARVVGSARAEGGIGRRRRSCRPTRTFGARMPVLVAHFFLAHVAALRRDYERLGWASQRSRRDAARLGRRRRHQLRDRHGHARLAARVFARGRQQHRRLVRSRFRGRHSCTRARMTMVHLSRLSEDLIIFCDEEHGFFQLSDASSTGSSMMPQKKNPDPLELIRGKAGRLIGHLPAGWRR